MIAPGNPRPATNPLSQILNEIFAWFMQPYKCRPYHFNYLKAVFQKAQSIYSEILWHKYQSLLNCTSLRLRIIECSHPSLNVLLKVSANINSDECGLINFLIKSHFSYCPFIWMFCNGKACRKSTKYKSVTYV